MTVEEIGRFVQGEVDESRLWHLLQDLTKMDTLTAQSRQYRIRMPLFERWMQANYTVERVLREQK